MTLSQKQEGNALLQETEAPTKERGVVEGWELLDPGDYFETEKLDVFKHFLNSKGTDQIECNLQVDYLTLVVRGSSIGETQTACVLLHTRLDKISRPDKIELIENIYAVPGLSNIVKMRLGKSLATYFNVQKDTDKE